MTSKTSLLGRFFLTGIYCRIPFCLFELEKNIGKNPVMARLSGKIRPDFVEKSSSGQILKTLIRYIPSEKHIYFKVLFTAKNIIVKVDSALRIIVSYLAVCFIAVIFQWALKFRPIMIKMYLIIYSHAVLFMVSIIGHLIFSIWNNDMWRVCVIWLSV